MELMVRCWVPDEPGRLARLAGAIGAAGGDIQAVDVLDHEEGRVLDDLVVLVDDEGGAARLIRALEGLEDVELVHAGPSRGDPGEAVVALAMGLQGLLDGSMEAERAVATVVGGAVRADECTLVDRAAPPRDARVLVLDLDGRHLVVRRDHRFTPAEHRRAEAIARACATALRALNAPTR